MSKSCSKEAKKILLVFFFLYHSANSPGVFMTVIRSSESGTLILTRNRKDHTVMKDLTKFLDQCKDRISNIISVMFSCIWILIFI